MVVCVLALLPVLAMASVYSEASLASRTLGHWPIPSLEDPKELPTWALHYVSALLVLSTLPGAILVGAISLKRWRVFRTPSIYGVWIGASASRESFAENRVEAEPSSMRASIKQHSVVPP